MIEILHPDRLHPNANNIQGGKYGRLTALFPTSKRRENRSGVVWLCVCSCGGVKYANIKDLHAGGTRSCGCLWDETRRKNGEKTGGHNALELKGMQFGRLTVKYIVGTNKHNKKVWKCLCSCGVIVECSTGALRSGNTRSCGCLRQSHYVNTEQHKKEYQAWWAARHRCINPSDKSYSDYGGRGIRMCDRWVAGEGDLSGWDCFFEDMGPAPSKEHSLDRKNSDGDYTPDNCWWAPLWIQKVNKRPTKKLLKRAMERGWTLEKLANAMGVDTTPAGADTA